MRLSLRNMNKLIKKWIESWDWKLQFIWEWDNKTSIPNLISRVESWYYQIEKQDIYLNSIDLSWYNLKSEDLYDFIIHSTLVDNANLDYPIILNRKWIILDWRHRLVKAIKLWLKKIKAIRILDSDVI